MTSSDHNVSGDRDRDHSVRDEKPDTAYCYTSEHDDVSQTECRRLLPGEQELQRAKQAVEKAPDIREDRVEAAKQALKSGKLKLDGAELAEKLLCDELHQVDLDA